LLLLVRWYRIRYNYWEVAMSITASEARRRLFPLIEEVNNDQAAIEIVAKSGSAYLVPAAEYESWVETAYLLRSPANAAHLIASYNEAMAGRTEARDLIAVDDDE
jgi:antitoxin YefM